MSAVVSHIVSILSLAAKIQGLQNELKSLWHGSEYRQGETGEPVLMLCNVNSSRD